MLPRACAQRTSLVSADLRLEHTIERETSVPASSMAQKFWRMRPSTTSGIRWRDGPTTSVAAGRTSSDSVASIISRLWVGYGVLCFGLAGCFVFALLSFGIGFAPPKVRSLASRNTKALGVT